MDFRTIVIAIISLFVGLPLLIRILSWILTSPSRTSPENLELGVELIVEAVIPWWIGVMQWLAGLPIVIAAILVVIFVLFLKWIREIG